MAEPSVFWFRKDLRLADHPALLAAFESVEQVFLVASADSLGCPFESLSEIRRNSLRSSWHHLSESVAGRLTIVKSPNEIVAFSKNVGASKVFASKVFDPQGVRELTAIAKDLESSGIELILGGSNYAVEPGSVLKADGTPYRVYTPFYREWMKHQVPAPVPGPALSMIGQATFETEFEPMVHLGSKTMAGEAQALRTLDNFLAKRVDGYAENRDRPDLGGTSHLSHALSHGEIHPRTILARLPLGEGPEVFIKELAWREFYADVLWHNQTTVDGYYDRKFEKLRYDQPDSKFEAWKLGKTGFPVVDAGMRQLITTGWMHNRVRMIVASFLVKDLHIEWTHGARWFEENLTDFDPASNSHGWQWTAGCGTDASPYYRVFNPITQGEKFDPNGDYVRKFIPELKSVPGSQVHQPWLLPKELTSGYPAPIVDHAAERLEALDRLAELQKIGK